MGDKKLTRCSGTMSESQFLSWVRSALRSKSLRWAPRTHALEAARRAYKGPVKQQKWEYQCAICLSWKKLKEVCVDHYPKAAGSILSVADIGEFVNNLYCETDNMRVLCKEPCHAVHTYAEAHGISFADAATEKEIIAICNKKVKEVVDFCLAYGYDESQLSNKDKRRSAVSEILKGVM